MIPKREIERLASQVIRTKTRNKQRSRQQPPMVLVDTFILLQQRSKGDLESGSLQHRRQRQEAIAAGSEITTITKTRKRKTRKLRNTKVTKIQHEITRYVYRSTKVAHTQTIVPRKLPWIRTKLQCERRYAIFARVC